MDYFVEDVSPIYQNDDILNMVTNASVIVKLMNGTAVVFDDPLLLQILGNYYLHYFELSKHGCVDYHIFAEFSIHICYLSQLLFFVELVSKNNIYKKSSM